jgi:AcrR family transcriptional regulator
MARLTSQKEPTAEPAPARRVRRDVQRNREALITAAREVISSHGIDAPLEHIARRAGVGIATLYRHFPTRVALVDAILTSAVQAYVEIARRALAMEDAWAGFVYYLERTCELEAADRGINDMMSMRLPGAVIAEATKKQMFELVVQIMRRAQDSGRLRADVTPEDLALLTWATGRIVEATAEVAPRAWRRHLGLLIDAFRAENAHELPVRPLTPRQVYRAMIRLGGRCTGGGSGSREASAAPGGGTACPTPDES